jgi:hypothetical protein
MARKGHERPELDVDTLELDGIERITRKGNNYVSCAGADLREEKVGQRGGEAMYDTVEMDLEELSDVVKTLEALRASIVTVDKLDANMSFVPDGEISPKDGHRHTPAGVAEETIALEKSLTAERKVLQEEDQYGDSTADVFSKTQERN